MSFNRKQIDRKKTKRVEPRVKSVDKSAKAIRKNTRQFIDMAVMGTNQFDEELLEQF